MNVQDLEVEILRWQASCVRKLALEDGEVARIRLLPVKLAAGHPWLRYGQHWSSGEPLTCPETTQSQVVDKTGPCPLCAVLDDPWHELVLRVSYLLYCLVLERAGSSTAPDALLRLHQCWMPAKVFALVSKLVLNPYRIFSWDDDGYDVCLKKQDRKLLVTLGPRSTWRVPEAAREQLLAAAASPKRRVRWHDLSYQALMLGAKEGAREYEREE